MQIYFGTFLMFGWPLAVLAIFAMNRSRPMAVVISMLAGWLFLPNWSFDIPAIPDYDKVMAVNGSVVLAIILFDMDLLLKFRPHWWDLPMLFWCLTPMMSSLLNELGFWDGISSQMSNVIIWGLPYLIGRLYFNKISNQKLLMQGLIAFVIVYFPLILLESRIGAQLHVLVYASVGGSGSYETVDWFGPLRYRPSGFLQTGLAVSMFVASGMIAGWSLWSIGRQRKLGPMPQSIAVTLAIISNILCKTLGGFTLAWTGIFALICVRHLRIRIVIVALVMVAPAYVAMRTAGLWSVQNFADFIGENISEARAGSLGFRLRNEDILIDKALDRPVFGWGRFGRARVYDENEKDISITDGLWIIEFGNYGLSGLIMMLAFQAVPVIVVLVKTPRRMWNHPSFAPTTAMAIIVCLNAIDNLPNAMYNPMFPLMMGALIAMPLAQIFRSERVRHRVSFHRVMPKSPIHAQPPVQLMDGGFDR